MSDISFSQPFHGTGPLTPPAPPPPPPPPPPAPVVGPTAIEQLSAEHTARLGQVGAMDFGALPFEVGPPEFGGQVQGPVAEMPPLTEEGKTAFAEAAENSKPDGKLHEKKIETPPMTDEQKARAAAVREKLADDASKAAFDKLAADGKLTRPDATGQGNVLDHLERLANHRALKWNPDGRAMLGELVKQIDNPLLIGQQTPNSCMAAHTQQELAAYEPGEYARMAADLLGDGKTKTQSGHPMAAYQLNTSYDEGFVDSWGLHGGLSGMFQASFMDYASQFEINPQGRSFFNGQGTSRYDLRTDQTRTIVGGGGDGGDEYAFRDGLNTKRGMDAFASMLVKELPKELRWYNDVHEWRDIASGVLATGKTPGCIINTGPGMQHMIRVTEISDDHIKFLDPTKPGEFQTMPMADFMAAFQNDPTKDTKDNTGGMGTARATSGSAISRR